MKLILEMPTQTGAFFTSDGSKPFRLIISEGNENTLEIEMSNESAKEMLDCLQSCFDTEAPDEGTNFDRGSGTEDL